MKICPKCSASVSDSARFCSACGEVLNPAAVHAQLIRNQISSEEEFIPDLISCDEGSYQAQSRYGARMIKFMRIAAIILSALCVVGGLVWMVQLFIWKETLLALAAIGIALAAGAVLYLVLSILIIAYENISLTARNTEMQYRIALAQNSILNDIARAQAENARTSRAVLSQLEVMDSERYDDAKRAERQTALLVRACGRLDDLHTAAQDSAHKLDTARKNSLGIVEGVAAYAQKLHKGVQDCLGALSKIADRTSASDSTDGGDHSDSTDGEEQN